MLTCTQIFYRRISYQRRAVLFLSIPNTWIVRGKRWIANWQTRHQANWVNFAKTGNPNGNGLPNWPAFDAAQQFTMELREKMGVRPVAEKDKLAFFTQYFARQR